MPQTHRLQEPLVKKALRTIRSQSLCALNDAECWKSGGFESLNRQMQTARCNRQIQPPDATESLNNNSPLLEALESNAV